MKTLHFGSSALLVAITLPACHDKSKPEFTVASAEASASAAASASTAPAASIPKPDPNSAQAKSFYADRFSKKPTAAGMTELGRKMFFDPNLSASKKLACSTCHDPKFAFGPPNDRATQLGGPAMDQVGTRAVPSLRYVQNVPDFTEHYLDEQRGDADQGPAGGHTWDGRASSLHDQAMVPLLSPIEMANDTIETVLKSVEAASYAADFKQVFGDDVFNDKDVATIAVLRSFETFQQEPKEFYPYTSRYDDWLRKKGELTAREQRGMALFNDPKKGNCAFCHISAITRSGWPQFTDFGLIAIGVPRNKELPANKDPNYFDEGLCGPMRTDLSSHKEYCGFFRAPSLRNVASRRVFFHNGVFHTLKDAVTFYADRDTNPAKYYGKGVTQIDSSNDLPPEVRKNVSHDPPFNRKPGEAAAFTSAEIDDIIVFLQALTDSDVQNTNAAKP